MERGGIMSIANKLTYLNDTKGLLKEAINDVGGELTDESTFRSYAEALDGVYDNLPKITPPASNELYFQALRGRMDKTFRGDISQKNYTGKNLLKPSANPTATSEGITQTLNGDGTITISGTNIRGGIKYWGFGSATLPAGTYYIYSKNKTSNSRVNYYLWDASTYAEIAYMNNSFTLAEEKRVMTTMEIPTGATVNDTLEIQIESGNTFTGWEPYVGGIPAPNPDYPQNVQVVKGKQVVKFEGKNLFDENTMIEATNAVRAYNSGRVINVNNYYGLFIPVKPNTNYISSSNLTSDLISNLCFFNSGRQYISGLAYNTADKKFTTPNNCYYVSIAIGSSYEWFQLEEGNTATSYEPYHAPNTYELNLKSKNLFDKNTMVLNGGIASDTGILSANSNYRTAYASVKPNKAYTISKNVSSRFIVSLYNGTNLIMPITTTNPIVNNNASSMTVITNNDTKYIFVTYASATDVANDATIRDSIQIEENSSASEYEPYFDYELCKIDTAEDVIKKSTGKNLFNADSFNKTDKTYISGGITSTILNGNISCNGTATSTSFGIGSSDYTFNLNLKNATNYVFSRTNAISEKLYIRLYNVDKSQYQDVQIVANSASTSFTTNFEVSSCYLYMAGHSSGNNISINSFGVMIEEGSTVSEYEPYGKLWYKKNAIGKVVLNGSESWAVAGTQYKGLFSANITVSNLKRQNIFSGDLYSNYFTEHTFQEQNEGITKSSRPLEYSAIILRIKNDKATNLDTFKSWLSTHNTSVYYLLANPTYTIITSPTLISQLESLQNQRSINGTNVITSECEEGLPVRIGVSALLKEVS